jgi:hypothetical protein
MRGQTEIQSLSGHHLAILGRAGVAQALQVAALPLGLGLGTSRPNAMAQLVALDDAAGGLAPRPGRIGSTENEIDQLHHMPSRYMAAQSGVFSLRCRRRLSDAGH